MITDASTAFLTASGFDGFVDQENSVRTLKQLLRKDVIPHALLFAGLPGVGKHEAALLFAMACNCAERPQATEGEGVAVPVDPCGACRSCVKIRNGHHPDVIMVEPFQTAARAIIRIDQIRTLSRSLGLKPREARLRAVIIKDADAMNSESGNALLKVLEEPPERTFFILTTRRLSALLPTILSRCQRIRFNPVSRERIVDHLTTCCGEPGDQARLIADMAGGSLARAVEMSTKGWINRHRWLAEQIDGLGSLPPARILALAEITSRNREHVSETLDIMETILRDRMLRPYAPDSIINKDLTPRGRYVSQEFDGRGRMNGIDEIEKARRRFESHGNARLTMEQLLFKLMAL